MRLQVFKNKQESCMLYASAMALDIDVKELANMIGHDGTECIWPKLPEPFCYKGITVCEVNDVLVKYDLHFGTTVALPIIQTGSEQRPVFKDADSVFVRAVGQRRGILIGVLSNGVRHAIATDEKGDSHDPMGVANVMQFALFHPLCSMKPNIHKFHNRINYVSN